MLCTLLFSPSRWVAFSILSTLWLNMRLQEGFEGQMTEDNIEIGICNSDGFRRLTPQARSNNSSSSSRGKQHLFAGGEGLPGEHSVEHQGEEDSGAENTSSAAILSIHSRPTLS